MAATSFTPISLYYSATSTNVPTAGNLVAGELAINTADGKLFYKDSGGVVQTLATKSATSGTFASVTDSALTSGRVTYATTSGLLTDNAKLTFDASNLTIGVTGLSANADGATGKLVLRKPDEATGNPAITRMIDFAPYYPAYDEAVIKASISSGVDTGTQNGVLGFMTAAGGVLAERMRIASNGSLFVGCIVDPDATTSGIRLLNPATGASRFSAGNTSASTNMINFYNSNGVVGTINTTGLATLYITSSDYRLKENVAPMTGALATISQLKPVTYDWKNGGSSQGFIAHELQAIVPECVVGEKDALEEDGSIKPQGIDTSFLVATLTAAIQELNAKVDAQAVEIASLKAK